MSHDRSSSYFLNTIERAAQKTIAVAIESCAGTEREPRAAGGASTSREWTDGTGRDWRVTVAVNVERIIR